MRRRHRPGRGTQARALVLKPDAQSAKEYSNLEVRWKAQPADLEKNAVDYRVALLTDLDEELAARDVRHSAGQLEKCRFSNDDFSTLSEDALLSARVAVSVVGRDAIERQESLNLCRQMVTAGVHPIVFSYHQDIDERLVDLVTSVRFVDFDGLGFNPLTVTNPESARAYLDVAGSLRDIFAAIYPELGDLQCESIRRAIKESFSETGWTGSEAGAREPEFSRFVEILRAEPKPDRGLRTLLARLTELDDYGSFDIGEARESLWTSDRPTVVRIHTTQNDALQRAFASLVFYGLYKDMFRRGIQERITHALIFDEAHRAAGLKLIPTMAKECRKYGISLVLASQEARDFDASLFSTVANYLVLRLTEADAKALVRNVATARQERSLIDKIKQMDRFRALYFCEGRPRPSSVRLHSLD